MMKSRGLGKGLGAIFTPPEAGEHEEPFTIAVEELKPNEHQPRTFFDPEKLEELVSSIKLYGVIQPLVVRKTMAGYEIVAGERRWRAAKAAGLVSVPAVIRAYSDAEMMEIALIENLQRHDLNPIEEAVGFQRLMEEFGLTQEEVAKKMGRSRSAVANTLRLLQLSTATQQHVSRGTLTPGQVRPILALNSEQQEMLVNQIIEQDMSAREVEEHVRRMSGARKAGSQTDKLAAPKPEDIHVADAAHRLVYALGTQVRIKTDGKKGKIEIDFYSHDDLERLLELLTAQQNEKSEQVRAGRFIV